MINKYKYNSIVWVDLQSPTASEITEIMKEYNLHPVVAEELVAPSSKGKFEKFDDYVYLVLHFPIRVLSANGKSVIRQQEVDFIVGKDYIITNKYDTVKPLHSFSKIFETNAILDKKGLGKHAGFVLYYMLTRLYGSMQTDLVEIEQDLLKAERRIFAGDEKTMVKVLSEISRELIDIRHTTKGHASTLEALVEADSLFGPEFTRYSKDIGSEFDKVNEYIHSNRDLLNELRDTNDSLLTTKQNETMKILTLLAFVTFPLSLFTDLFSMDTSYTPIVGHPYDFEIILGIMILATLTMFGWFKYKKWL